MTETAAPSTPHNVADTPADAAPKAWLVALIAGLMALNALAIDIMLPALPEIASATGLTSPGADDQNLQQWIIFAYVLGFGAPQIVWGPLTDRFGRRAPLVVSLVGYCLMGLACSFIHSAGILLAARFLQGVFAAGARIVAVSVVRDLYEGRQMARFMSLAMSIFMIVPIIAPLLGQAILLVAPWEGLFLVLSVGSALLLVWALAMLPETLPPERRKPLSLRAAVEAYRSVLTTRVTAGYMLASGVVFGALFAFVAASEQIFDQVFGVGAQFGLWFAVVAGTLACGNIANASLVVRFGMRRLSHMAVVAYIVLSALLVGLTLLLGEHLWLFLPLFSLVFACFGMMGSNFSAIAMQPLGAIAGTAAAAYGFATTTLSAALGALIGGLFNGTTLPLSLGLTGLGILTLVIIAITERGRLFVSN
jgi:MFS transporter, DHA1 family, multidrug resistance protein